MLGNELNALLELSKMQNERLQTEMKVFETNFDKVLNAVPAEQRGILEKVKAMSNKAFILAKNGDQAGAQQIIKDLTNECQNIKKAV